MAGSVEEEQSLEQQVATLRELVNAQQVQIQALENRSELQTDPLLLKAQKHWITHASDSIGWWGAALTTAGILKSTTGLIHADQFVQDNIWVLGFMFAGRYGGIIGNKVGVQAALRYEQLKENFSWPPTLAAPSLPNLSRSLSRHALALKAVALIPFSRIPF